MKVHGNTTEELLEEFTKAHYYHVPAWYTGEGILINNAEYKDCVLLPEDYSVDIATKSGGVLFDYSGKWFINHFFRKHYRGVVEFMFNGIMYRGMDMSGKLESIGVGSNIHSSINIPTPSLMYSTADALSYYMHRAAIVRFKYENGKFVNLKGMVLSGNLTALNNVLSSFDDILHSDIYDKIPHYNWPINWDVIY